MSEASILFIARLQLNLAIKSAHVLHFGGYEITLDEELPHILLVLFTSAALLTPWQINGGEVEDSMAVGVDINRPTRLLYGDDASDDNVTDIGAVALTHRADTDHLVDVVDHSGQGSVNLLLIVGIHIGTVTRHKARPNKVSRNDHFHVVH